MCRNTELLAAFCDFVFMQIDWSVEVSEVYSIYLILMAKKYTHIFNNFNGITFLKALGSGTERKKMNSDVGDPCDRRASPKDHVQKSTSENIWNLKTLIMNVVSQHKNLSRLQRIPWKHCKNDVMEAHEMELLAWEYAPIEIIHKFKNSNIEIWSSSNNVRLMSITIDIYKIGNLYECS